jgi:hypothetical protein
MQPENLDLGGFSHIKCVLLLSWFFFHTLLCLILTHSSSFSIPSSFAFAVISPDFRISFQSPGDADIARRLLARKSQYPGLRIGVAVGGWAFSQDLPTRSLFSRMIDNAASRATFIASVNQMLNDYGFDGIDIDFEVMPTFPAQVFS